MLRDLMTPLLKGLEPIAAAAGDVPVYLVGGAVRDLLLGRERTDVDVAVEGDAIELARHLAAAAGQVREHERFGTATVRLGDLEVDLARTRTEEYERPGALPDVRPAEIADDLRRRDFTINAMAVPLADPDSVLDPHSGREDLEAGRLRILHQASFRDDPTRALRAARYSARFGFELESETEAALRDADLATVSADRIEAELQRIVGEEEWKRAFQLLADWGLAERADLELMQAVRDVLERPGWRDAADPGPAALAAGAPAIGTFAPPPEPRRAGRDLVAVEPGPPSRLAASARAVSPVALVIGRAMGAEWLDRFVAEWRDVRLEIGGEDLLGAGIEQGPAVGRGLSVALAAKLDGDIRGREAELEVAVRAARTGLPPTGAG